MPDEQISDKNALRIIAASFIMAAHRTNNPAKDSHELASAAVADTNALFQQLNSKPKNNKPIKHEHRKKEQQEHSGN